jgi:hypothetical protein|nr:MAG TPA_asm: hypothetical protein [Caudoviricetes sp.]
MKFSTLEIIGLAFLSGLKISEIAEELIEEEKEEKEEKEEIQEQEKKENMNITVKSISPEEMGEIFDKLKNKVLGGND